MGSVTFGPNSERVTVGPVEVPTFGGLPIRVRQSAFTPFQFGYCLLSFESSHGRELGTIRVWPRPELTSYVLGAGLEVVGNHGVLVIEPRTWNLRWVLAGFTLSVDVLADIPTDLPPDRVLPDGFADVGGAELFPVRAGSSGRLQF